MGVGRRNDRTKWQSKELLIVVSLEWADMFSGSHMRPAEDTCPLAWLGSAFIPWNAVSAQSLTYSGFHQLQMVDKWRQSAWHGKETYFKKC